MLELFNAFLNSLYNPEWLKKQRLATSRAWSYFAIFVFVFSLAFTIAVSIEAYPVVRDAQKTFSAKVPDFEATFKGGSLAVNLLPQPYIYRYDNDFVVVVDTQSTSSKSFVEYVTSSPAASLLVTADRMEFTDNLSGEGRTQSWTNMPDGTANKTQVEEAMKNILRPWYYFLGMFAMFVGFYIVFFIGKLYTIVVTALVASVFARFTGRDFTLKSLFTIGLYAVTLPSLISVLFTLLGVGIGYIQFMAMLAFMLAVVFSEKKTISLE